MKTPGLLATLQEAFVGGGIEIATPLDAPRIRTVIMANAVILQFIAADAAEDRALQERHARDVAARITGVSVRRLERGLRWVERGGWAVSAGSWALWASAREDVHKLWVAIVSSLLTSAVRWVVPWIIRSVLGWLVRRELHKLATQASLGPR